MNASLRAADPLLAGRTPISSRLRQVLTFPARVVAPLPPPAVWNYGGAFAIYLALAGVAGAVLAVLALLAHPPGLLALALLIACIGSSFYVVEVVPGGSLWSPDDFLIFSGIFILGPTGVLAAALGLALGHSFRRRAGTIRLLYTSSSIFLDGLLAWLVCRAVLSLAPPAALFTAAVATGVAYETASLLHIMLGTSLGRRRFVGWSWLVELRFTLPFTIGYAWAAVGASSLYTHLGAAGISMVYVPVALFQGFLVYLARKAHQYQGEIQANHQERVRLLEQLVVKQRGFVSDASHELRTPLTTLSGSLEMMHQLPDMDRSTRETLVTDALGEARRMSSVVNAMLELARLDQDDVRQSSFEWPEVLQTVVKEMRDRCAPRALEAQLPDGLGTGFGDTEWLRELFSILASNIAVHTPSSATATVTVTSDPANERINIAVADDGPGVPEAMLEQIFERFVQIDPSRHGSEPGLGLAIARSIVTAHDGTIRAEAVEPHGLRVVVRLPAFAS